MILTHADLNNIIAPYLKAHEYLVLPNDKGEIGIYCTVDVPEGLISVIDKHISQTISIKFYNQKDLIKEVEDSEKKIPC